MEIDPNLWTQVVSHGQHVACVQFLDGSVIVCGLLIGGRSKLKIAVCAHSLFSVCSQLGR